MATQANGFMGGFAGTLGPAIGYFSRGKWCVRSRPSQVHNPRTEAQQAHRGLFKAMVQLAATLGDALRPGLRHEAAQRHLSVQNLFVALSKEAFAMVEGEARVDYGGLRFSQGPVSPVGFGEGALDEYLRFSVSFEKNPTRGRASSGDMVYLLAYCPGRGVAELSDPAARRSGQVQMLLPTAWEGEEVHLYGFVRDLEGRASVCSYLGGGELRYQTEDEDDADGVGEELEPAAAQAAGVRQAEAATGAVPAAPAAGTAPGSPRPDTGPAADVGG